MNGAFFILGVLFLTIVAPIWIIAHYVTRWRAMKTLSVDDERALADLWQSASRIESRIENVERILDAEMPGWRSKA